MKPSGPRNWYEFILLYLLFFVPVSLLVGYLASLVRGL
jgi:hypothetical protein